MGGENEEKGRRRGEEKGTNQTLVATVYHACASGACSESPIFL